MSRLRAVVTRLLTLLPRRRSAVPALVPPLRSTVRPPPPPPPPPGAPSRQVLRHAGMPVRMLFDDGTVLELIADPLLERRLAQLLEGIRTQGRSGAEVAPRR